MKLARKLSRRLAALFLAMMMTATPQMALAAEAQNTTETTTTAEAKDTKEIRLQDDFYAAINKEWLATAKIKPGYSAVNAGSEVYDKCQEQIQEIFDDILKNESKYKDTDVEKKMINLYKNYLNTTERNKQGIEPIKPYLDKINNIKTLDDLDNYLSDLIQSNMSGLYACYIDTDFKNSNKNAFYLSSTNLLLGDSDAYTKPSEQAKRVEKAATTYFIKMLQLVGYSKEEAEKKVADAYAFDKKLAPSIIGQEEATQMENLYASLYNPKSLSELDQLAPHMKLQSKINKICNNQVSTVIVTEPKWLEAFDKMYTEENVAQMKNYLEIQFLSNTVSLLSDDFTAIAEEYNKALTGVSGRVPAEEEALSVINSTFSDELGKLYVQKYFSKEAKADVEELVNELIAAYKKKLQNVDWMTDATKQNAIKKLDTMKVKIGYPDTWPTYEGLTLQSYEEGGSLLENSFALTRWSYAKMLEKLNKPVDRSAFVMAPQTVDACYNPTCNDITFPAGILQAPFYDKNRSRAENLGSIGAIIGHEISHAFDTTGANFDENGNIKQWWTEEDYKNFQAKAQTVKDYYNHVKTDAGMVNGDLTVGENIADITGLSCALDVLKESDNPDYKAFFEAWAKSWCMISTEETAKMMLEKNVHSPHKVRANVVVSQFQEFYDTYDVKEGDGMYVKPEDRLKIY